jgi:hypothetical protein
MTALNRFVEDYFGSTFGARAVGDGIPQGAPQIADPPPAGDRASLLTELSAIEKDLRDLVARHDLSA